MGNCGLSLHFDYGCSEWLTGQGKLQYQQQEAESFFGRFKQDVAYRLNAMPTSPFEAFELYMKQLSDFNAFYVREPALLPDGTKGFMRYCHVITGLFFCE